MQKIIIVARRQLQVNSFIVVLLTKKQKVTQNEKHKMNHLFSKRVKLLVVNDKKLSIKKAFFHSSKLSTKGNEITTNNKLK